MYWIHITPFFSNEGALQCLSKYDDLTKKQLLGGIMHMHMHSYLYTLIY